MPPIYLDYNATTPIDPAVREAMRPYLEEHFGNPSSGYVYGQRAKEAVEHARVQVATLIGCTPPEIVFTSGGTESDNHAIVGAALANARRGKHIVTSRIEHPAVTNACRYLEKRLGFRVTYLPVDLHGLVNPDDVKRAITSDTILITTMHANNETGTIEPIEEIGSIAREHGTIFHTDAAQSCGKIDVQVDRLNVDLLTIAGHKIYAPKGIGALFIRTGTIIDPIIHGAGQERGKRAGTENVPYIVGLGMACDLAKASLVEYGVKTKKLRDRLYSRIVSSLGEDKVLLNGHPEKRLPNTLNISIPGLIGEDLLARIPEMAACTGSACHAGSTEPSSVLVAMGLSAKTALATLRLSVGRWTTEQEVDRAAELIVERAAGPA
ncbi:MAG: cysteine desulfurase [Chloroflexi bacterium]|nr:cysteine desulfurase [Chloroflexota bacterium]